MKLSDDRGASHTTQLPLDALLEGRSSRSIHRDGGCDSRALQRIRAGKPVRSDTVVRLARALEMPVHLVAAVVEQTIAMVQARGRS